MQIDWFPLWLSLRVAAISTLLSLAIGLWVAWLLARRDFRGRAILDAAVTLPFLLPPTVLGYYLLVLLGSRSPLGQLYEWAFGAPLLFTWQAAVVAAMFHSAPLLILFTRAAIDRVDPIYESAARTLGAPEWKVFLRITLPLAKRAIFAATAIAFARSLGDFGITLMIAGNTAGSTQTLALAVFDAAESGEGALARTLVVIASVLGVVFLALANRIGAPQPLSRQAAG
ncbi:MAG: molybdate ABC transporter permease subunit [Bryobacteraceae bacterium]